MADKRVAELLAELREWDGSDGDELEETLEVLLVFTSTHAQARAPTRGANGASTSARPAHSLANSARPATAVAARRRRSSASTKR